MAAGRVATGAAEHRALDVERSACARQEGLALLRRAVTRIGRLHTAAPGRAIKALALCAAPAGPETTRLINTSHRRQRVRDETCNSLPLTFENPV